MCNDISSSNEYDVPTIREKEIIQKLEEATDEIDALLRENEKLMTLSNELRFELQKTKDSSSTEPGHPPQTEYQNKTQENEQTLLDAILNDHSRSCDSESHDSEVACIGRKPPLSSAADYRSSKNAQAQVRIFCLFLFGSILPVPFRIPNSSFTQ